MGIKMNFRDVRRELKAKQRSAETFIKAEGTAVMRSVFADTQIEVPKDTGALVSSGKLTSDLGGPVYTWEIQYGDSNVDGIGVYYAAAVHNRRATHAPPTKMKYVEDPLTRSTAVMRRSIARAMRRAMS